MRRSREKTRVAQATSLSRLSGRVEYGELLRVLLEYEVRGHGAAGNACLGAIISVSLRLQSRSLSLSIFFEARLSRPPRHGWIYTRAARVPTDRAGTQAVLFLPFLREPLRREIHIRMVKLGEKSPVEKRAGGAPAFIATAAAGSFLSFFIFPTCGALIMS